MIEASVSSNHQAVEEFSSRFSKQAGVIYYANSPDEVISTVNGLIESRGKGESCAADYIEITYNGSKENLSKKISTTVEYQMLKKTPRQLVGLLDIGVTKADCGVAETGTIVDVSFSDEHRLLSSLTRVHIAVLESSSILAKLSMLSSRMKDLLRSSSEQKPSISFIGGPSRTSDIELKSVLGVHGPHEVHVVLI
jgi:L-lactate utilization protein LutC